jgi:hypothetical protein
MTRYVILYWERGLNSGPGDAMLVSDVEQLLYKTHQLTAKGCEYRVHEVGKCIADTVKLEKGEEWKQKNLSETS